MEIKIQEVTTLRDLKRFIEFSNRLYKNNPYYVPPLMMTELETLERTKNPAFEFCDVKYWLAFNDKEIVGRIAGIINHRYNQKVGQVLVRFGWFDFIENIEVASILLQTVEQWGKENGAQTIHGPLGFLEFDPSGILVEGFNEIPTAYGKYNFPYYPKFLETLGFEKEVDWIEYQLTLPDRLPSRYSEMAQKVAQRYNVRALSFRSKKELLQYTDQIFDLLNDEYDRIHGFYKMSPGQIEMLKKQFVPLLRLKYVAVVVDSNNKVIGFGITMPSLSKALQRAKGNLFPFGIFHLLKAIYINDTIDTLLIAVDEKYHNKGINALLFYEIGKNVLGNGFNKLETTRQLETNVNIQNLWKNFEYKLHKRARCFQKKIIDNHGN